MTIRFGMIGTGAMAAAMLPAFRLEQGADLCAVSSSNFDRAQAFAAKHNIAKPYGDLNTLLGDDEIDAVYIANRTSDHADTSIAALRAGKHVLCEKPFAMNADDGARVVHAAREAGTFFMEGLWTLFLPAYQRAYESLLGNEIGTPTHLVAGYGYPTSVDVRPRLFDARDGGVLLDLGVYPIALALRLFGDIQHFDAHVGRNEDDIDTHLSLQLRHQSGATSQLTASFDMLASNAAFIGGKKGQIRIPAPLFGAEELVIESLAEPGVSVAGAPSKLRSMLKQNQLLRRLKSTFSSGGERHPYGADQYLPQMSHFVAAVTAGKQESDVAPHELSLKIMQILDQIRTGEGSRS